MSEFKWTDELVYEFINFYDELCKNKPTWTSEAAEKFKEKYSNTHTVKADESNVVDGGSGNWEIISVASLNSIWNKCSDGKFRVTDNSVGGYFSQELIDKFSYNIHSVKRLSDGEIISVGENRKEGEVIKITYSDDCRLHIHIRNKKVLPYDYPFKISEIEKQKPILFTTEDGKPIYNGDKFYTVTDDFEVVWSDAVSGMHLTPGIISRSYSTEEAANTYILHKKPLLSYDDVSKLYESLINRFGRPFLEQLKELVKSKINK